jgi:uncharacterized protein (TIGR02145 family)/uncharacterized repeat protein (TIGR02543 family)
MFKGLSVVGLLLPFLLLVTCKELPTNPFDDPLNLKVSVFLEGNKVSVIAGDSVQVGVTVNIPKLVKSLKSIDGEENTERVLTFKDPLSNTPDTIFFKTLYKTPGSKTLTVKAMLTDNMATDYPLEIVVLTAPAKIDPSVWKTDTLSITTTENSVISKSIDSLLTNKSLTDVSFVCDKGSISQRLWSDTIRWGARVADTVVITASYNGKAYPLKMFIKTSSADVSLPNIVLVEPSIADATISSNVITCKFTITDSLSGIGNVVFRIGTTILSDTLHSGDTYQCTVRDLPKGVKTTVTVDVIDRSQKKNPASKEISLTYNPDMQDNVGPVISLKNPLVASFSVSTSETTILLQCTDQSGVKSVTAKKGSTALVVQKTDSVYSIPVASLIAGKTDTIIVTAIDSSAAANPSTLPLYIKYEPSMLDTKGPVITLKTPSNNTSIPVSSVTMRVVCWDISNIATVSYKIGTITGIMTKENDSTFSAVVSGLVLGKNQITISAKDASVNTNSSDSVFTFIYDQTMNDTSKPVITFLKAVRDTLLVNVASTTIDVLCTDSSGIDKVVCSKGTSTIPVTSGSGNLYSAAVSGLTAGANTFIFTVTDKAAKPNSDSKTIVVIYDPTATDITGPTIKLSSPAPDRSKVAQASATLVVVCTDENKISSVNYTFGTVSGAMTKDNDSTFSVALSNLVKGDNQITILATDASSRKNPNDTVFTIIYDPTLNDNAAPVITLKTPEKDSTKVSSKSITVEVVCTDSSGVDTVTCKVGTTDVSVVKGAGGVYSASMITLAAGTFTFTFTATDKASTKHSSTKTVTVICDPSMIDNVPPTVVIKNPQSADQRVFTDTITVQIDCSDDNNISSVTATRGGVAVSGITNAGSLYSVKVTALTAGKSDTINFKVVDNSSNKVSKDFPVILRFNRKPVAATLGTPSDGATGAAKSPTFTWTDGTDPDGDAVTYTLRYGTSETAMSKIVPNITGKTTTLTTPLSAVTKYYWQVITITGVNGDTVVSGIASFTTVEDAPVVAIDPESKRTKVGSTATFTITATGLNPKYQWQKGTSNVATGTGATTATYTTAATVAGDNGSTYRCIVTNNGGADTSAPGTLTIMYSVTYNDNGSTSGSVPTDDITYANSESVTVKLNSGSLVRSGYTFAGWNTAANGSGTARAANTTFTMGNADVTLFAQWTAIPTYTITYNGNGSNGGSAPVDINTYVQGVSVTVAPVGTLTRSGYTFAGWNTAANGSGTARAANTTFTMGNADVTLFAQWTAIPTYTVTYNGNGSNGGSAPSDNNRYVQGATVTVATGSPTRSGYTFAGWNTAANGNGTAYNSGATFLMGNANVTLFAQWNAIPTYTVTYNGNTTDATGNVPSDNNQYVQGTTVTVAAGSPTRSGYTFVAWNTAANGSGTVRNAGTTFPMGNANVTLYAQWNALPTYTVTYMAEGGSGAVPVDTRRYTANSNVTVLTGGLTKTAFVFDGWSRTQKYKASDSPVTSFSIGNQDVVLYARWVVIDYDGNKYDAVTIGSQTWLVQNLKVTRLRNGGAINNAITTEQWVWRGDQGLPAYSWPNNSVTEGQTYGALYNWYVATTSNLAPAGWHVPTNEEYEQLISYADKDCKVLLATSEHPDANNRTGFTAIATPTRLQSGEFSDAVTGVGSYMMWSSDPGVWYFWLQVSSAWLPAQMWNYTTKAYGYPIRLIKD